MKSVFFLLALILVTIFIVSCKKDTTPATNTLIFGTHYGECAANCVNIYKLDDANLQKDGVTQYMTNYTDYNFTGTITLDVAKYETIKHLLNEIPPELLTTTNKAYGCPDCHDQGGLYIEVNKEGGPTRYNIDLDSTSDQSADILLFKRKVLDALASIQ